MIPHLEYELHENKVWFDLFIADAHPWHGACTK